MDNNIFSNKYFRLVAHTVISLLCIFAASDAKSSSDSSSDKILATVNGESIYESQISEGVPVNSFDFIVKQAKVEKLERRITYLLLKQFLKRMRIHVGNKEVDKEIESLKKDPPPLSCGCCSYPNLDSYMSVNYYTMDELRRETANDLGMDKYLDKLWQQKYPRAIERKALVQRERAGLEKKYVKVSHIFFNTFQQPEFSFNPEKVEKEVKAKAEEAWEHLNNGEPFEKVAKNFSDDAMSKKEGGPLGCVPIDIFGTLLENAKPRLNYGEHSKPLSSLFGFHIIKFSPMSDDDILALIKMDYFNQNAMKIYSEVRDKAQIVKNIQE